MSMTSTESTTHEVASYGGLADAAGGIAAVVLAIIGLSGTRPEILLPIATIVFGAALLIQSGTILSELSQTSALEDVEQPSGGGLSIVFLAGIAGIVLGVLALIGVQAVMLSAIAVIAFGAALVFGSTSVMSVYRIRKAMLRAGDARLFTGAEVLANEAAAGSVGIQCIAGLAGVVLGILAVTGVNAAVLSLVALLAMGSALLLTGGTLSGAMQGFMKPVAASRTSWSRTPAE